MMKETGVVDIAWNAPRFAIRLVRVSLRTWANPAAIAGCIFCTILLSGASASSGDDQKVVAALDTQYQAAVKNNDAATMDRLLADDFILVTGSGKTYTKSDLLAEARSGRIHYEHQEDFNQTVRVWGNTAVITARLRASGTDSGTPFDYIVWFSDVYLRTSKGWQYTFGQSSLHIPPQEAH